MRFVDVYGTNGYNSIGVQVGRANKSGIPVIRERQAMADLIAAGENIIFIPYN